MCTYVIFLLIVLYLPVSVQLDFFCFPNGTLIVTTPRPEFDAAHVTDEFGSCKPTFSDDNKALRLDECKMDHYVQVMFYKATAGLPLIIGGKNPVGGPYRIMCNSLPPEGIEITVRAGLKLQTHIEEISQKAENVQVTRIVSHVEDENSQQFQTLQLNDKLEWVFEIEAGYHTVPESCTAYAGRHISTDVDSMALMENGCSRNRDVLSHFSRIQSVEGTDKNRYVIPFSVFRFDNDPFITVACRMRVCADRPGHRCSPTCGKRKKRSAINPDTEDTVNEMALVVEVMDDITERQSQTERGHTLTDERTRELWKQMMKALDSGSNGLSVTMTTLITSTFILMGVFHLL